MSDASPPPTTEETYALLLAHLFPSPPAITDISILPSSFPPHIHILDTSIGIPKPLLTTLFLHARSIFFSPESTQQDKYLASGILQLWDGNHLTACGFRKRYLLRLRAACSDSDGHEATHGALEHELTREGESAKERVQREWIWLTSLLTSPLYRHTKSETLWSHRIWLLRNFSGDIMSDGESRGAWLSRELEDVMKAGERHPRNYYAWWYGRLVVQFLCEKNFIVEGSECEKEGDAWKGCVGMVHSWCLAHPRDISGWSFLVYLMDRRYLMIAHEMEALDVIGDVFRGTEEFVQKYKWRGESIEWFSKSKRLFYVSPNG
ncbi:MAG: hypothetical protein Q9174_000381 [Haloplaca sp. 1 TL-2023]